jgi:hypothetical protein
VNEGIASGVREKQIYGAPPRVASLYPNSPTYHRLEGDALPRSFTETRWRLHTQFDVSKLDTKNNGIWKVERMPPKCMGPIRPTHAAPHASWLLAGDTDADRESRCRCGVVALRLGELRDRFTKDLLGFFSFSSFAGFVGDDTREDGSHLGRSGVVAQLLQVRSFGKGFAALGTLPCCLLDGNCDPLQVSWFLQL